MCAGGLFLSDKNVQFTLYNSVHYLASNEPEGGRHCVGAVPFLLGSGIHRDMRIKTLKQDLLFENRVTPRFTVVEVEEQRGRQLIDEGVALPFTGFRILAEIPMELQTHAMHEATEKPRKRRKGDK